MATATNVRGRWPGVLGAATLAALVCLGGAAQAQLTTPPAPFSATLSAERQQEAEERRAREGVSEPAQEPGVEAEIVDDNAGVIIDTPEGERAVRAVTPDLVLVVEGDAALRAGHFAAALGRYQQALAVITERHPGRVDVLLRIGLARSLLGDCAGALAVVRGVSDRLAADPAKAGERRAAFDDVLAQCARRGAGR